MVRDNRQSNKYRDQLDVAIKQSDVPKILSSLFTIGVGEGASYIFFIPFENYGIIGIRIDGKKDELMQCPISTHKLIVSKFKIESDQMKVDVENLEQEAKISIITETYEEANLKAKIFPTAQGEKLVIRITEKPKINISK